MLRTASPAAPSGSGAPGAPASPAATSPTLPGAPAGASGASGADLAAIIRIMSDTAAAISRSQDQFDRVLSLFESIHAYASVDTTPADEYRALAQEARRAHDKKAV